MAKFQLEEGELEVLAEIMISKLLPHLEQLAQKRTSSKLMTVKEVASFLNVSSSWVYDQVRERKIPFVQAESWRGPRFHQATIEKWLKKATIAPL